MSNLFIIFKSNDPPYRNTYFAFSACPKKFLAKDGIYNVARKDYRNYLDKIHRFKTIREAIQKFHLFANKCDIIKYRDKKIRRKYAPSISD